MYDREEPAMVDTNDRTQHVTGGASPETASS
jgi:hypothetical protein